MNTISTLVLVGLISGAITLTAYILVRKILLKGQKEAIIRKAELEAEAIKKQLEDAGAVVELK